jgi:hypothetical protein
MENLKNYVAKLQESVLAKQQETGKFYVGRCEAIGACKTLWIPESTRNRSASIDLNHTIIGFNEKGELWGENGNCGTAYRIIEIPSFFTEDTIRAIGEKVNAKSNNIFPQWNNALRADNIELILETIKEFIPAKSEYFLIKHATKGYYQGNNWIVSDDMAARWAKRFKTIEEAENVAKGLKSLSGDILKKLDIIKLGSPEPMHGYRSFQLFKTVINA